MPKKYFSFYAWTKDGKFLINYSCEQQRLENAPHLAVSPPDVTPACSQLGLIKFCHGFTDTIIKNPW